MRPTVFDTDWMPLDTADVIPCQMFDRYEPTRFHTLVHTPLMAFRTVEMVLLTFWMHVDTTPLIAFQMVDATDLTAFQMLVHTPLMALRTVPIVVLMPLMIGMKNATILFHTSVKNVLMAVHTVVQTA